MATDFSDTVVKQNIERGAQKNLQFTVLDMAGPFPYDDQAFDAVYAYLSLHYYSAEKTREIFQEIARVLKPRGKLYFTCKSVHDHKFGEGEQIAPDIFIRNEHIRHFFSMPYTRQLVEQNFEVVSLEETSARYIEDKSSFIECWAVKKENNG